MCCERILCGPIDVRRVEVGDGEILTVDVISAEQTSQTYLTPPSPPRLATFLRMTPIAPGYAPPRRTWAIWPGGGQDEISNIDRLASNNQNPPISHGLNDVAVPGGGCPLSSAFLAVP